MYHYLQFKLGLKQNILVRPGHIGVLQHVLQAAVDDTEEAVHRYLIHVVDVCLPDVRLRISLEQLQVLLQVVIRRLSIRLGFDKLNIKSI